MKTLNQIIAGALIVIPTSGGATGSMDEKCEAFTQNKLNEAKFNPFMASEGIPVVGLPDKYAKCANEILERRAKDTNSSKKNMDIGWLNIFDLRLYNYFICPIFNL